MGKKLLIAVLVALFGASVLGGCASASHTHERETRRPVYMDTPCGVIRADGPSACVLREYADGKKVYLLVPKAPK